MQIIPRPYQEEAKKKALPALKKFGKALIVLATGLGKTIASALIVKSLNKLPGIFLVHNNDILERSVGEFQKVFGNNIRCGLYNGQSKQVKGCDIVFASFQTMVRNLKQFKRTQFDWMIVDEGHHAQAETYRQVIEYFQCDKLGVTATPDRMDMRNIRDLFGNEVVSISLEEAIARGWLPRIEYHLVSDEGLDENRLRQISKEVLQDGRWISLDEINRRIFIRARDKKIAGIIEGYSEKTVIFCRNIPHAKNFRKFFRYAETYHSGNSRETNRRALTDLRNGLTRRVLAVNAFNEGIDIPDVGLVVFNRSTDSETIFRQQLGRGMRPGKNKLVVLDFVGNAQRIAMLKKITDSIARYHEDCTTSEERDNEGYAKDAFHLTGKGFEFTFADTIVDLMKVIDKVNVDLYPTWEEASQVAIRLGFKTSNEYRGNCNQDHRLPTMPTVTYKGTWPGWDVFLSRTTKYPTWQEAGKAAIALGIRTSDDYRELWRKDPRLPSNPNSVYSDWPGYTVFLGGKSRDYYPSWQQASKAARKLGLTNTSRYEKEYSRDQRLPSTPHHYYKDFPGYEIFLMGKKREFYPTWQESAKAAQSLGIKTHAEYGRRCIEDELLTKCPDSFYKDFPDWYIFLGQQKRTFHHTWQDASKSVIKLRFKNSIEYRKKRYKDPLLPAAPETYYADFPGWRTFLGGKLIYQSWQEASRAAISLGIKNSSEYATKRRKDTGLPGEPNKYYLDFPGWSVFLPGSVPERYKTWQEASKAAQRLGIKSQQDYRLNRKYSADAKLPGSPYGFYKDFPGWDEFLGKV